MNVGKGVPRSVILIKKDSESAFKTVMINAWIRDSSAQFPG